MAAYKTKIFDDYSCGASMTEVLLSMAIVAVIAPLLYTQISDANHNIRDMAVAQNIVNMRGDVANFVRLHQDKWPDVAQIKLADEELDNISQMPVAGFIDKYMVRGATITDVYLAFDLDRSLMRTARVANHIGDDAAVVGDDGIAYGRDWAVSAPDFKPGNLIYRISRDISGEDKSKYLHRGTASEDNLNVMQRDLNMGNQNVYNVGGIAAKSAQIKNGTATFIATNNLVANTVYFSDGANLDGANAVIGNLRVSGDISGFRNIYADNINGRGFTTNGRIITDRASVSNSVNVANDMILKSDTMRTVSGFTGISVNSVNTSYLSSEEIIFYDNFGLTVSGELLMSTTAPLKIGSWTFPTTNPPRFNEIFFTRASIPAPPVKGEFGPLLISGWQSIMPQDVIK